MAHHQQRARELQQQLLEQVERLDIEIVRRLVEHEHVERSREESREEQAIALASGQRTYGRPCAIGRKEKVLQISEHVPAIAADLHEFGAVGDAVEHRRIGISCSRS